MAPYYNQNGATTTAPAATQMNPVYNQQFPMTAVAFVNNENEIPNIRVMPGQTVFILNMNEDVFYIKSSDVSGMLLPLRTFDFKERVPQMGSDLYATKDDINELRKLIEELTK